ncbi:hypothetical protein HPP92_020480 [Vanilla planifolia]|uniref:Uncharacterized protein n=1 Tax=Vanilla planifolia TaxID=51239 RepID=A0A835PY58_VANPL|nr:hypothetical protein HPP92_020480 [Vanilla planifolia]
MTAAVVGLAAHFIFQLPGPAAIVIGAPRKRRAHHGMAVHFSVLLFQDLAVVVLLILDGPLISPKFFKRRVEYRNHKCGNKPQMLGEEGPSKEGRKRKKKNHWSAVVDAALSEEIGERWGILSSPIVIIFPGGLAFNGSYTMDCDWKVNYYASRFEQLDIEISTADGREY